TMRDDDLHIVEDDTKEDSQTPTDKGSVMDEDELIPSNSKLASDVTTLQKQCTMLAHQMNIIMGAFRIPRCTCDTCGSIVRSQMQQAAVRPPHPHPLAAVAAPAAPMVLHVNGHPPTTPIAIPMTNGIKIINPSSIPRAVPVPLPVQLPVTPKETIEATPSENGSTSTEGETKDAAAVGKTEGTPDAATNQLLTSLFPGVLQTISNVSGASGGAPNPFAEQNHGGRKSKYCTPDEKKVVAEYASMHGAANAARKFGIPPSVAAYYQRKLARIKQNDMQAAAVAVAHTLGVPPIQIKSDSSVPSTAEATVESPLKHGEFRMDCTPATPTTPSYLRGRGRGRPKLIGDELDAELIEYMVKLKADNPNLHLNPSNALDIARAYIMQHSPGLLEENGGNVKLKLTWAMKLVSRIAERQKEIQLGLPIGSLSNMGRTGLQQLDQLSGANIMAEMTQSLISQIAKLQEEQIMMPEITNVKELNLADFTMMGGVDDAMMGEDKEDEDGGVTPDEDETTNEKTMEAIAPCQPSLTAC
ncbi:hypothetical protein PFISCL1PPCAC_26890, partial [Pristionchus fissidentatus]